MDSSQTVQALGALAHETRLALYRMLVERGPDGLPAGVIAERLGLPPSSLTFHVQHLHRAGLITQRRLGRQLIYAADFSAMNDLFATSPRTAAAAVRRAAVQRAGRPRCSARRRCRLTHGDHRWTAPKSRNWSATATARSPRRVRRAARPPLLLQPRGRKVRPHGLHRGRNCSAVPEGANLGLGCGNPAGDRRAAPGRGADRSRQRRRLRLSARRAAGRARGPRDRRRHDARDAGQGARQRRPRRRRPMSSSAWANSSTCRSPTAPAT